jgi:hypothetical protein
VCRECSLTSILIPQSTGWSKFNNPYLLVMLAVREFKVAVVGPIHPGRGSSGSFIYTTDTENCKIPVPMCSSCASAQSIHYVISITKASRSSVFDHLLHHHIGLQHIFPLLLVDRKLGSCVKSICLNGTHGLHLYSGVSFSTLSTYCEWGHRFFLMGGLLSLSSGKGLTGDREESTLLSYQNQ